MRDDLVPDALIPAQPDYEYLAGVASNPNLPVQLRANLLAAVRHAQSEQERIQAAVATYTENATRWELARNIFSWEDVAQAYEAMRGFDADPEESMKTDHAIDIALRGGEIDGDPITGRLKFQG